MTVITIISAVIRTNGIVNMFAVPIISDVTLVNMGEGGEVNW